MRFLMFSEVQSLPPSALPTILPLRSMKWVWGWLLTWKALATWPLSSIKMGQETLNLSLNLIRAFSFSLIPILYITMSAFLDSS